MVLNMKASILIGFLPALFACKPSVDPNTIWGDWSCVYVTIKGPILRGNLTFSEQNVFSWKLLTVSNSIEPNRFIEINEKGVFSINETKLKVETSLSEVKNNGRMTKQREELLKYLQKEFRSPKSDTYNIKSLDKGSLIFYPDNANGSEFQCKRGGLGNM